MKAVFAKPTFKQELHGNVKLHVGESTERNGKLGFWLLYIILWFTPTKWSSMEILWPCPMLRVEREAREIDIKTVGTFVVKNIEYLDLFHNWKGSRIYHKISVSITLIELRKLRC